MRRNENLTRVTCTGIVDADDYSQEDKDYLLGLGVATLPVSEIENLILLPSISRLIAQNEGYTDAELETNVTNLADAIFESLTTDRAIEKVVTRYCRRRIDRLLKKIDFSDADTVSSLSQKYAQETAALNIEDIATEATNRINEAIDNRNLQLLLANYDNKGMMALAATHLKRCRLVDFEHWLARVMRNNSVPGLIETIQETLPDVEPS